MKIERGSRPDPALAAAPFNARTADAPDAATAHWVTAADGLPLRVGVLGRGDRGTILLLHGRTEYLEKYGRAARALEARGYTTVSVDFRGQGLSGGRLQDRIVGHVESFADYQHDINAMRDFAIALDLPRPWYLLAHSMGGAIGLRALHHGLDVHAAVFSAPMWGIEMLPWQHAASWCLGSVAHVLRLNAWITPGMEKEPYVHEADASDNLLTGAPEMLEYMRTHLDADPDLALGAPNVPWLFRAKWETRALMRAGHCPVPSLTFLPELEEIVSSDAITQMTSRWPDAELVEVPGGSHETMMETEDLQEDFFDRSAAFFERHA